MFAAAVPAPVHPTAPTAESDAAQQHEELLSANLPNLLAPDFSHRGRVVAAGAPELCPGKFYAHVPQLQSAVTSASARSYYRAGLEPLKEEAAPARLGRELAALALCGGRCAYAQQTDGRANVLRELHAAYVHKGSEKGATVASPVPRPTLAATTGAVGLAVAAQLLLEAPPARVAAVLAPVRARLDEAAGCPPPQTAEEAADLARLGGALATVAWTCAQAGHAEPAGRALETLVALGVAAKSVTLLMHAAAAALQAPEGAFGPLRALDSLRLLRTMAPAGLRLPAVQAELEADLGCAVGKGTAATSLAADGTHVFVHVVNGGLFKVGTGRGGSVKGVVHARNEGYLADAPASLAVTPAGLLVRSELVAPAVFAVVDLETLQEVGCVTAAGTGSLPSAELPALLAAPAAPDVEFPPASASAPGTSFEEAQAAAAQAAAAAEGGHFIQMPGATPIGMPPGMPPGMGMGMQQQAQQQQQPGGGPVTPKLQPYSLPRASPVACDGQYAYVVFPGDEPDDGGGDGGLYRSVHIAALQPQQRFEVAQQLTVSRPPASGGAAEDRPVLAAASGLLRIVGTPAIMPAASAQQWGVRFALNVGALVQHAQRDPTPITLLRCNLFTVMLNNQTLIVSHGEGPQQQQQGIMALGNNNNNLPAHWAQMDIDFQPQNSMATFRLANNHSNVGGVFPASALDYRSWAVGGPVANFEIVEFVPGQPPRALCSFPFDEGEGELCWDRGEAGLVAYATGPGVAAWATDSTCPAPPAPPPTEAEAEAKTKLPKEWLWLSQAVTNGAALAWVVHVETDAGAQPLVLELSLHDGSLLSTSWGPPGSRCLASSPAGELWATEAPSDGLTRLLRAALPEPVSLPAWQQTTRGAEGALAQALADAFALPAAEVAARQPVAESSPFPTYSAAADVKVEPKPEGETVSAEQTAYAILLTLAQQARAASPPKDVPAVLQLPLTVDLSPGLFRLLHELVAALGADYGDAGAAQTPRHLLRLSALQTALVLLRANVAHLVAWSVEPAVCGLTGGGAPALMALLNDLIERAPGGAAAADAKDAVCAEVAAVLSGGLSLFCATPADHIRTLVSLVDAQLTKAAVSEQQLVLSAHYFRASARPANVIRLLGEIQSPDFELLLQRGLTLMLQAVESALLAQLHSTASSDDVSDELPPHIAALAEFVVKVQALLVSHAAGRDDDGGIDYVCRHAAYLVENCAELLEFCHRAMDGDADDLADAALIARRQRIFEVLRASVGPLFLSLLASLWTLPLLAAHAARLLPLLRRLLAAVDRLAAGSPDVVAAEADNRAGQARVVMRDVVHTLVVGPATGAQTVALPPGNSVARVVIESPHQRGGQQMPPGIWMGQCQVSVSTSNGMGQMLTIGTHTVAVPPPPAVPTLTFGSANGDATITVSGTARSDAAAAAMPWLLDLALSIGQMCGRCAAVLVQGDELAPEEKAAAPWLESSLTAEGLRPTAEELAEDARRAAELGLDAAAQEEEEDDDDWHELVDALAERLPAVRVPFRAPKGVAPATVDGAVRAVMAVLLHHNHLGDVARGLAGDDVPEALVHAWRTAHKVLQWLGLRAQERLSAAQAAPAAPSAPAPEEGDQDQEQQPSEDDLRQQAEQQRLRKVEVFEELVALVLERCALLLRVRPVPMARPRGLQRQRSGSNMASGSDLTDKQRQACNTLMAWTSTRDGIALRDALPGERPGVVWRLVLQLLAPAVDAQGVAAAFAARRARAAQRATGLRAFHAIVADTQLAYVRRVALAQLPGALTGPQPLPDDAGRLPELLARVGGCGAPLTAAVHAAFRGLAAALVPLLTQPEAGVALQQTVLYALALRMTRKDYDTLVAVGMYDALAAIVNSGSSAVDSPPGPAPAASAFSLGGGSAPPDSPFGGGGDGSAPAASTFNFGDGSAPAPNPAASTFGFGGGGGGGDGPVPTETFSFGGPPGSDRSTVFTVASTFGGSGGGGLSFGGGGGGGGGGPAATETFSFGGPPGSDGSALFTVNVERSSSFSFGGDAAATTPAPQPQLQIQPQPQPQAQAQAEEKGAQHTLHTAVWAFLDLLTCAVRDLGVSGSFETVMDVLWRHVSHMAAEAQAAADDASLPAFSAPTAPTAPTVEPGAKPPSAPQPTFGDDNGGGGRGRGGRGFGRGGGGRGFGRGRGPGDEGWRGGRGGNNLFDGNRRFNGNRRARAGGRGFGRGRGGGLAFPAPGQMPPQPQMGMQMQAAPIPTTATTGNRKLTVAPGAFGIADSPDQDGSGGGPSVVDALEVKVLSMLAKVAALSSAAVPLAVDGPLTALFTLLRLATPRVRLLAARALRTLLGRAKDLGAVDACAAASAARDEWACGAGAGAGEDAPGVATVRLLLGVAGKAAVAPAFAVLTARKGDPARAERAELIERALAAVAPWNTVSADGALPAYDVVMLLRHLGLESASWQAALRAALRAGVAALPEAAGEVARLGEPEAAEQAADDDDDEEDKDFDANAAPHFDKRAALLDHVLRPQTWTPVFLGAGALAVLGGLEAGVRVGQEVTDAENRRGVVIEARAQLRVLWPSGEETVEGSKRVRDEFDVDASLVPGEELVDSALALLGLGGSSGLPGGFGFGGSPGGFGGFGGTVKEDEDGGKGKEEEDEDGGGKGKEEEDEDGGGKGKEEEDEDDDKQTETDDKQQQQQLRPRIASSHASSISFSFVHCLQPLAAHALLYAVQTPATAALLLADDERLRKLLNVSQTDQDRGAFGAQPTTYSAPVTACVRVLATASHSVETLVSLAAAKPHRCPLEFRSRGAPAEADMDKADEACVLVGNVDGNRGVVSLLGREEGSAGSIGPLTALPLRRAATRRVVEGRVVLLDAACRDLVARVAQAAEMGAAAVLLAVHKPAQVRALARRVPAPKQRGALPELDAGQFLGNNHSGTAFGDMNAMGGMPMGGGMPTQPESDEDDDEDDGAPTTAATTADAGGDDQLTKVVDIPVLLVSMVAARSIETSLSVPLEETIQQQQMAAVRRQLIADGYSPAAAQQGLSMATGVHGIAGGIADVDAARNFLGDVEGANQMWKQPKQAKQPEQADEPEPVEDNVPPAPTPTVSLRDIVLTEQAWPLARQWGGEPTKGPLANGGFGFGGFGQGGASRAGPGLGNGWRVPEETEAMDAWGDEHAAAAASAGCFGAPESQETTVAALRGAQHAVALEVARRALAAVARAEGALEALAERVPLRRLLVALLSLRPHRLRQADTDDRKLLREALLARLRALEQSALGGAAAALCERALRGSLAQWQEQQRRLQSAEGGRSGFGGFGWQPQQHVPGDVAVRLLQLLLEAGAPAEAGGAGGGALLMSMFAALPFANCFPGLPALTVRACAAWGAAAPPDALTLLVRKMETALAWLRVRSYVSGSSNGGGDANAKTAACGLLELLLAARQAAGMASDESDSDGEGEAESKTDDTQTTTTSPSPAELQAYRRFRDGPALSTLVSFNSRAMDSMTVSLKPENGAHLFVSDTTVRGGGKWYFEVQLGMPVVTEQYQNEPPLKVGWMGEAALLQPGFNGNSSGPGHESWALGLVDQSSTAIVTGDGRMLDMGGRPLQRHSPFGRMGGARPAPVAGAAGGGAMFGDDGAEGTDGEGKAEAGDDEEALMKKKKQGGDFGGRAFQWAQGDVIGCLLDLEAGEMTYVLNGQPIEARVPVTAAAVVPLVQAAPQNNGMPISFRVNFGRLPWVVQPPAGFLPLESARAAAASARGALWLRRYQRALDVARRVRAGRPLPAPVVRRAVAGEMQMAALQCPMALTGQFEGLNTPGAGVGPQTLVALQPFQVTVVTLRPVGDDDASGGIVVGRVGLRVSLAATMGFDIFVYVHKKRPQMQQLMQLAGREMAPPPGGSGSGNGGSQAVAPGRGDLVAALRADASGERAVDLLSGARGRFVSFVAVRPPNCMGGGQTTLSDFRVGALSAAHPLAGEVGTVAFEESARRVRAELTAAAAAGAELEGGLRTDAAIVALAQRTARRVGGANPAAMDAVLLDPTVDDLMHFKQLEGVDRAALRARFCLLKHMNALMLPLLRYMDVEALSVRDPAATAATDERVFFGSGATLSSSSDVVVSADGGLGRVIAELKGLYFMETKVQQLEALLRGGGAAGGNVNMTFGAMGGGNSGRNVVLQRLPPADGPAPAAAPAGPAGPAGPAAGPTGAAEQPQQQQASTFEQLFQALQGDVVQWRSASPHQQMWNVTLLGEGSIDAGGPYRESVVMLCGELMSDACELFVRCPNGRNDVGLNREKWVVNPGATSSAALARFRFVGALLGLAIRTKFTLPLNLASVVWKGLLGERLELGDLEDVDKLCLQALAEVRNLGEGDFGTVFDAAFTTHLSSGAEVPLEEGGEARVVTAECRDEYCNLVAHARLHEADTQLRAMRRGLLAVVPAGLALFAWHELELLVCGSPEIDVLALQGGLHAAHPTARHFWRAMRSFSTDERQLLLRFVWGRNRLPPSDADWKQPFTITLLAGGDDEQLPQAHTCFFQLDLPQYSNYQVLRSKLLFAIMNCQAIDTDFNPEASAMSAAVA